MHRLAATPQTDWHQKLIPLLKVEVKMNDLENRNF
jgi:hypothetical protein